MYLVVKTYKYAITDGYRGWSVNVINLIVSLLPAGTRISPNTEVFKNGLSAISIKLMALDGAERSYNFIVLHSSRTFNLYPAHSSNWLSAEV